MREGSLDHPGRRSTGRVLTLAKQPCFTVLLTSLFLIPPLILLPLPRSLFHSLGLSFLVFIGFLRVASLIRKVLALLLNGSRGAGRREAEASVYFARHVVS